jgi:TetR/AcrR family transcriptional repressor of mexCD-oprJ operon
MAEQRERAVRSDAVRNRDAILDAAADCLTANPSSTLADIAKAASVARITLYGHFASRNELLMALLHRSMVRVESELAAVDLDGPPWEALEALVRSSWQLVNSLAVLRGVVEEALPDEAMHGSHADPRARVEHLLARGRADGLFRSDQSIAWQSACYFALLHGAAAEIRAGRLDEAEVEENLLLTLRALLQASPGS